MNRAFIAERIKATKATIIAYENAVLALGEAGGIQSYTLDTTQSRQTVTRADIPRLQTMIGSLYNQLVTLEARLGCGGSTYAGPAW